MLREAAQELDNRADASALGVKHLPGARSGVNIESEEWSRDGERSQHLRRS
ncbi:hypothetical protein ACFSEO_04060 [Agromyces cerinus subsp. nitratus]|uniref:hypothetical protein n=1 Tax=Agromyces cerinus TaxID=33878 RepID=UPI00362E2ABF